MYWRVLLFRRQANLHLYRFIILAKYVPLALNILIFFSWSIFLHGLWEHPIKSPCLLMLAFICQQLFLVLGSEAFLGLYGQCRVSVIMCPAWALGWLLMEFCVCFYFSLLCAGCSCWLNDGCVVSADIPIQKIISDREFCILLGKMYCPKMLIQSLIGSCLWLLALKNSSPDL